MYSSLALAVLSPSLPGSQREVPICHGPLGFIPRLYWRMRPHSWARIMMIDAKTVSSSALTSPTSCFTSAVPNITVPSGPVGINTSDVANALGCWPSSMKLKPGFRSNSLMIRPCQRAQNRSTTSCPDDVRMRLLRSAPPKLSIRQPSMASFSWAFAQPHLYASKLDSDVTNNLRRSIASPSLDSPRIIADGPLSGQGRLPRPHSLAIYVPSA